MIILDKNQPQRMDSNRPIRCFQHCDDRQVLCLDMPSRCPLCDVTLQSSPMRVPPFRLESPFKHSADVPQSFVIRPADGADYGTCRLHVDDLHVGISDSSSGTVVHYNHNGLNIDTQGWQQVLAVRFSAATSAQQAQNWDTALRQFATQTKWSASNYNENSNNCFTFALEFLKHVTTTANSDYTQHKAFEATEFCKRYVIATVDKASKYLQLLTTINDEGYAIQDHVFS